MLIVPSILTDSLETAQAQINQVASLGLTRVQIDVIDPDFADNSTIHPIDLLELDLHQLHIDLHLMTNDPIQDVVECSQVPGIQTIIAQIERMPDQKAYIDHVQSYGIGVGFSLDAFTQLDELAEASFAQAQLIQLMGNKAGKQGQQFLGDPILQKIQTVASLRNQKNYSFLIAVDIGMTPEHAKSCGQVGADMVTPGSYLWTAKNLQTAIEAYR